MRAYMRAYEPPRGETAMLASFLLVAAMAFFVIAAGFLPVDTVAWKVMSTVARASAIVLFLSQVPAFGAQGLLTSAEGSGESADFKYQRDRSEPRSI